MNLLGILTLVAVGLILAAVAAYLIVYLVHLRRTLFTLGTVNVGVRAIARRVEPLEPILGQVNGGLAAVRDDLAAVVRR